MLGVRLWDRAGLRMDRATFEECRYDAGLSVPGTAEYLGVTVRTVQRWRKGGAPDWALFMLRVRAGHMPWPGWEGWQIDNGYLFPPGFTRHGISPGDISALPFLYQLLAEYKAQVRSFNALHDQSETCRDIPSWGIKK